MTLDITKYHLNLTKVFMLEKRQQKIVMLLFDDMLIRFQNQDFLGTAIIAQSLISEGFLVSDRDRKITSVLEDDE
jgi:hypothetical protein